MKQLFLLPLFLVSAQAYAQNINVEKKVGLYTSEKRIGQSKFKYCDVKPKDILTFKDATEENICVQFKEHTGWLKISELSNESLNKLQNVLTFVTVEKPTSIYSTNTRIGTYAYRLVDVTPQDQLLFHHLEGDKVCVMKADQTGWLLLSDLTTASQQKAGEQQTAKNQEKQAITAAANAKKNEDIQARKNQLKQLGHNDQEVDHIIQGTVFIGMRSKAARASWGSPDHVNKSTGTFGVHEQWVYPVTELDNKYLYFENNVLTTIQE